MLQEQEVWSLQQSCQELRQQLDSFVGSWRGQVDELKAQLRGEATRVLELQKKAYDAKMANEAAQQVCNAAVAAVYVPVTLACTIPAACCLVIQQAVN